MPEYIVNELLQIHLLTLYLFVSDGYKLMDIELLKTFLEVKNTRHFGKAAENLYLTQASVVVCLMPMLLKRLVVI